MNKVIRKDANRLIKNNFGRFLMMVAIILIGTSFFVGVGGSSYIMGHNISDYMHEYSLKDISVYSELGFDDSDVDAISKVDGVTNAYGQKFMDTVVSNSDVSLVSRIYSLNSTDNINKFELVSGRMPESVNEVLTEKGSDMDPGLSIGTKIKINDNIDKFTTTELEVVGQINTPLYMSLTRESSTLDNQTLETYFYGLDDLFNFDYYTEVNVLTKYNDLYAFDDEYFDKVGVIVDNIKDLANTQSNHRIDSIKSEYDDGYQEYLTNKQDANEELNNAYNELIDNKEKLLDALNELDIKESELNNQLTEINNNLSMIHDGLIQLNKGLELGINDNLANLNIDELNNNLEVVNNNIETLNKSIQEINDGITFYNNYLNNLSSIDDSTLLLNIMDSTFNNVFSDSGLNENNTVGDLKEYINDQLTILNTQKSELDNTLSELETNKAQIEEGINAYNTLINQKEELTTQISELEANQSKLETSKKLIEEGLSTIEISRKEVNENLDKVNDGFEEYNQNKIDVEEKLSEAKSELDDSLRDIESLSNEWTVLDRESHYSSKLYRQTVEQMRAIGNLFPLFFMMVASLVFLTTLTRMIDEDRGLSGTLLGLGYTKFSCVYRYHHYALLATVIGSVLGIVVGLFTFPIIIYNAWNMMYIQPRMQMYIPRKLIVICLLSFMAVTLLTTTYVSYTNMNDVPSQLLRPKLNTKGKKILLERISIIWSHLSFLWKITLRNLFRYKKRMLMTVIGVAGCSALMITGFGIKNSIDGMVHLQFDEIMHYDGIVESDSIDELVEELNGINYVKGISYTTKLNDDSVYVQTYDSDSLYTLRDRKSHQPISLGNDGVVISEKLSEQNDISVGDMIVIEDIDGNDIEVKVSDICEMYINHYLFMSEEYYKEVMGEFNYNCLFVDGDSSLQSYFLDHDLVKSVSFFDEVLDNFNDMSKSLDYIVLVLIFASLLLALVVLGNLMSINISERQREIATLKVLGFYPKEVQRYIYRENNILTLFGALLGIPLGIWLHRTIMLKVEFNNVMYGRSIEISSFVICVILTVLFGIIVNIMMRKKLNNIEMVESLKSVE